MKILVIEDKTLLACVNVLLRRPVSACPISRYGSAREKAWPPEADTIPSGTWNFTPTTAPRIWLD